MCVQVEEMLQEGHTLTTKFKTHLRYGYQPALCSDESSIAISFYVSHIRPTAVANAGHDSLYLFLAFNGSTFEETGLGRHLTSFFRTEAGLNINSTALRSLVETTVDVSKISIVFMITYIFYNHAMFGVSSSGKISEGSCWQ